MREGRKSELGSFDHGPGVELFEHKATVAEAHPYDCPCLLALPVTDGLPEFLDWIRSETFPEREA